MGKAVGNLLRLLILLILIALLLLIFFRFRFGSSIRELAEIQVENATSDLINDAVIQQIAVSDVAYDRMIYFEKDLNGKITALKSNIGEMNRLKSDVLRVINEEILDMDSSDIGIPIGSLILSEIFSGKGPMIPVHIISVRNSDASFDSHFVEAGINQTLHQISMCVSVDIAILVFGQTEKFQVQSQVLVSETVIVGDVPETLLQNGGNHGSKTEN